MRLARLVPVVLLVAVLCTLLLPSFLGPSPVFGQGPWVGSVRVLDPGGWRGYTPAIAADGVGTVYAVWEDPRNDTGDIYSSIRPPGGAWQTNERVNDDSGSAWQLLPKVAVDGAGNAYAVWTDPRNGNRDIYFSYRPVSGSWTANVPVNDDAGTAVQESPAVALDGAGNAHAVWTDLRNGNRDIYAAYRPANGSWGVSERVNDDLSAAIQDAPAIAVDQAGNAYAVWQDSRTTYWDIYFAYRPAGGAWGANTRVTDDAFASQLAPSVAVDQAGNAYAVWKDYRDGTREDIYFARRPAGGSWGTNVRVNDGPPDARTLVPAIAVDSGGNATALWADERTGFSSSRIYAASRPVGGSWGANVRLPDDAATVVQVAPAVGVDGAGRVYALWQEGRGATSSSSIYFGYRLSPQSFFPVAFNAYAGGW